MRTRQLSQYENAIVRKYEVQTMYHTSRGAKVFSRDDIDAAILKEQAARQAAQAAATAVAVKADSEYFTSAEFRDDVMTELMAKGANWEQACNRTRDQARLFNEAAALGMM